MTVHDETTMGEGEHRILCTRINNLADIRKASSIPSIRIPLIRYSYLIYNCLQFFIFSNHIKFFIISYARKQGTLRLYTA